MKKSFSHTIKFLILTLMINLLDVGQGAVAASKTSQGAAAAPKTNNSPLKSDKASSINVLFDGYYKLSLQKKPIGYVIQRYEFDKNKNQFISKYYIRMKTQAGTKQESLVAISSDKFVPLSFRYTSMGGKNSKVVIGNIKGNTMRLNVGDGKGAMTEKKIKLPPKTFFSVMLQYLMLNHGISENQNFKYYAIAEDLGRVINGKALVKKKVEHKGVEAFQVYNKINKLEFVSFMDGRGEVLEVQLPAQGITSQLVPVPARATQNQKIPQKTLFQIFGEIPSGLTNVYAKGFKKSRVPSPAKDQ